MVCPNSMALVVRQRGGPNLIVHTRGIPGSLVHRACEEAVTIMGRFALGRGQTDVDGSGDIHPKFAHDKLLVLNGRYAVVYRLVYKVWVMAVTRERHNSLVAVRLVETATKGLVATCQILEVDHEVISRNYQEAYFMMGAILKYQGADLQKSQAEALANIYSYIADTREKKAKSGSDSSKRVSFNKQENQKLSDFSGENQKFNFALPDDVRRLQGSAASADMSFGFALSGTEPAPATTEQQNRFSPVPFPSATSESLAGVPTIDLGELEAMTAKPPQTAPVAPQSNVPDLGDLLGMTASLPPAPVQQVDFFDNAFELKPSAPVSNASGDPFLTEISTVPKQDFPSFEFAAPAAAAFSPVTQPKSPPKTGPMLYLKECWKGTFQGGACTSSQAKGEVGLRKHVWKQSAGKELKFQLRPSDKLTNQNRGLHYCMKCASRNSDRTRVDKDGVLHAKLKPALAPYLLYRLLPGLYDIPVHVHVSAGVGTFRQNQTCLIVLIQVSTNPKNRCAAKGSIFALLPHRLGSPAFTRPRSQFSQKQSCLKWTFKEFRPNQRSLFKAVFPVSSPVDEETVKSIRVEMNCIGQPGTTFSGVLLSQEGTPGDCRLSETSKVSLWTASVTARP